MHTLDSINPSGKHLISFFARALVCSLIILAAGRSSSVMAATLEPSDIIVGANLSSSLTNQDFALVLVDPATGNRTIISDDTHGSGPSFDFSPGVGTDGAAIYSVEYESNGNLLITEEAGSGAVAESRILQVDPTTGNRTVISTENYNNGVVTGGNGPFIGMYYSAQDFGGRILASGVNGSLGTIDSATGDRTLYPPGGSSGPVPHANGFAIDGTNIYVADLTAHDVVKLDTLTGVNSIVSGAGVGSGPTFIDPIGVIPDGSGGLYVSDVARVFHIDPATGNRTIISSSAMANSVGTGANLFTYNLAYGPNGSIIATQAGLGAAGSVLSIDPVSGNRTLISGPGEGSGPDLYTVIGLAVVPSVPEPSSIVLAFVGLVAVPGLRRCFL